MMSKERELLKRWLAGEANQIPTHVPLLIETQNLLAQPEALAPEREFIRLWYENIELWKVHAKEPEQEPVAWMWDEMFCEDWTTVSSVIKPSKSKYVDNVRPLYPAPPKREPLSDEEIFDIGYKAGFAIDQDESADYESDAYGFLNGDGYVDNEPYFKLVKAIEKAHGIGGGE